MDLLGKAAPHDAGVGVGQRAVDRHRVARRASLLLHVRVVPQQLVQTCIKVK